MSDEQRQIEDAIEQAGNPIAPEQADAPTDAEWRTWSGRSVELVARGAAAGATQADHVEP